MSTPVILCIIAALAVLCLLGILFVYSRERSGTLSLSDQNADLSSSDRESFTEYYRPMAHMLDAREFAAARALSGVGPEDFTRFRSRRIASFRSYLNDMRLDFNRIDFKTRYLLLSAPADDSDLVQQLNKLKFDFQLQVWRVEFQFLAFRLGYGTVEITPLIEMLEQFEASLIRQPSANTAMA